MALIIQALCDACMAEDATSTGKTVSVSLDSGRVILVDLCAKHTDALVTPLRDLLTAHGRDEDGKAVSARTGRAQKADSGTACVYCGLLYSNVTAMSAHIKIKHPQDYPTYMQGRGMLPVKCKVKGCGQTFYGAQAIRMHENRAHGK